MAVHEFAIHPTAGEIVAATHGRSIWILDVTPLRQATKEAVTADAHLFKPTPAVRWATEPRHGGTNRRFVGTNPQQGTPLYYAIAKAPENISLKVMDVEGKTLRTLRASAEPGLHRVQWDLTAGTDGGGKGKKGGFGMGGGGKGGGKGGKAGGKKGQPDPDQPGGGFGGGRMVPPGTYRIVLTVDDRELSQTIRVEADPAAPRALGGSEEDES